MEEEFGDFYERWLGHLDAMLHHLLGASREPSSYQPHEHRALVAEAMSHYRTYYATKSAAIDGNAAEVLCPYWLSSLERAFLWLGGWRPRLAFHLFYSARKAGVVRGSWSEEQERTVAGMLERVKEDEAALEEDLKKLQLEAIVQGEEAMERVVERMRRVVAAADGLRMEAMKKVVGVLMPLQAVEYLGAAAVLQVRLHEWGVARDCNGGVAASLSSVSGGRRPICHLSTK